MLEPNPKERATSKQLKKLIKKCDINKDTGFEEFTSIYWPDILVINILLIFKDL
jgi:hypothetical protein